MIIPSVQNLPINPVKSWGLLATAITDDVAITIDLDGTYTVEFWFFSSNTATETIIDFTGDGGTGSIGKNATNFTSTSGTIYVNGVATTSFTVNIWQHVSIRGMTIDSNNSMNIKGFRGIIQSLAIFSGSSGFPNRSVRPTGHEKNCVGYWPGYRNKANLAQYPDISKYKRHGTISGAIWTRGPAQTSAVAAADVRMATRDGEAMIWVEGLDLSAYAGELGNTPWMLTATDGTGMQARGYVAGKGGGLALSEELISNPRDYGSFLFTTLNINPNGKDIDLAEGPAGSSAKLTMNNAWDVGSLYTNNTQITLLDGELPVLLTKMNDTGSHTSPVFSFNSSFYRTSIMRPDMGVGVYEGGLVVRAATYTKFSLEWSIKKVVDCSATGVHLVSALNGSTRNMAFVGTGFDPNNITSITLRRVK